MGHAYDLQLFELSEVFKEAFDADLRNAVAHADYIIAPDALRIRKKMVDTHARSAGPNSTQCSAEL